MATATATRRAPAKRTRTHAKAATRTAPVAPRRKSGPATRPKVVARPKAAPRRRPLARVAQGSASVLVDSLLRGPAWVVVIGVLLAGIVFLNVSVLELNRGIARTDAKAVALERSNSSLRERVASLDSAERIQQLAEARGFVLPAPDQVTYLKPNRRVDARLAAKQLDSAAPADPVTAPATPTPTVPMSTSTTTTTPTPTTATTPEPSATPPSAAPAAAVTQTPTP